MLCLLIMLQNGSLYDVNRIDPSTEPCGTPKLTLVSKEESLPTYSTL